MFQVALGKTLELIYHYQVTYLWRNGSNGLKRPFEYKPRRPLLVNRFENLREIQIYKMGKLSESGESRWLMNRLGTNVQLKEIKETQGSFLDINEIVNYEHVFLDGYWQDFRLFKEIWHLLPHIFAYENICLPKNHRHLVSIFESTSSTAVHVRRGDYLFNQKTQSVHGLCSNDYYTSAMKQISENYPNSRFYIFSDSPSWVYENMNLDENVQLFSKNRKVSPIHELIAMSRAQNIIASNSSFSWWAAFLSNLSKKEVGTFVLPYPWTRLSFDQLGYYFPGASIKNIETGLDLRLEF